MTGSEDLKCRRESFWNKVKKNPHFGTEKKQTKKKTHLDYFWIKIKFGMKKIIGYENGKRNNGKCRKIRNKPDKIILQT